jgi:hypothetical protein
VRQLCEGLEAASNRQGQAGAGNQDLKDVLQPDQEQVSRDSSLFQ